MKNKYDVLKEKFRTKETVIGTTLAFFREPILIDIMAGRNLDYVLFDTEHGNYDTQALIPFFHACRQNGIPSIVRVQDACYHLIAKAIDMGADGIMLPRTETLEQLQVAVDAMRFHPIGKKGCGGMFQFRPGETMEEFQEGRFLIPQIESPQGIALLPEMLEKYGDQISAIMVGPFDMSVMVGTPRDIYTKENRAAVQQVFDICKKYNKSVGSYCCHAEDARAYKAMGANIFWACLDRDFFTFGLDAVMSELEAL